MCLVKVWPNWKFPDTHLQSLTLYEKEILRIFIVALKTYATVITWPINWNIHKVHNLCDLFWNFLQRKYIGIWQLRGHSFCYSIYVLTYHAGKIRKCLDFVLLLSHLQIAWHNHFRPQFFYFMYIPTKYVHRICISSVSRLKPTRM